MLRIRDALNLLDQRTLIALAEKRGVAGARSNADRCSTLARSYRGDVSAFAGDLRRDELIFVLRSFEAAERGSAVASRTREQLIAMVVAVFGGGPEESVSQEPPTRSPGAKSPPLLRELDELLPSWLARLDTPAGSRDPLGLQSLSGKHADAILPGLTVFTTRARYYSFLCWAIKASQDGASPDAHVERGHRLERLLVLSEALLHGDDRNACQYIGARRGRAHVREQAGSGLLALPSRILKNQTGNGALRLYRTSLVDFGLVEEVDLDGGLGLALTPSGQSLAERFEPSVDGDVAAWALDPASQRKRRETIESHARNVCLSASIGRKERTLLVAALFGRDGEGASLSAHQRRTTARHLLREGILEAFEAGGDVVPDDDAVVEDGGAEAARQETRGNWHVVRALANRPAKAELHAMQVAATYQLLALSLNHLFRACVDALGERGRVSIAGLVAMVGESSGGALDKTAASLELAAPTELATVCLESHAPWSRRAWEAMQLILGVLRNEQLATWLGDAAAEDKLTWQMLEIRSSLASESSNVILERVLRTLMARHRDESVRKGKAEWIRLEDDCLVRVDPRELMSIIHSLRFAQLGQLMVDLRVREDEVNDVA